MQSFLILTLTPPVADIRSLDTEISRFYDRYHQMCDAALLTGCYTQRALRPFIDSNLVLLDILLNFLSLIKDSTVLIYQAHSRINQ